MPRLELELRVDVKVVVRLMTRPNVPPFIVQLQGNESVRILKQMARDHFVEEGQFGVLVDDDELPRELFDEREQLRRERQLLEQQYHLAQESVIVVQEFPEDREGASELPDELMKVEGVGVIDEVEKLEEEHLDPPATSSESVSGSGSGSGNGQDEETAALEGNSAELEATSTMELDMEEADMEDAAEHEEEVGAPQSYEEEVGVPQSYEELLAVLEEKEAELREKFEDAEASIGGLVRLTDMALFQSEYHCDDHASVWSVAMQSNDNFDAARHELELTCTLDKGEYLVSCSTFDNIIMGGIVINTFTMSLEYYVNPWTVDNIGINWTVVTAEYVFSLFFAAEMLLKILCLKGFCVYWKEHSNKFDFLIVMSSLMAFPLLFVDGLEGAPGINILRVFRLFRALRVARILRKVKSVRMLIDSAFGSIKPLANIMVCMMLIIIVFGCVGMQLYGSKMDHLEDRRNFDDFPHAFYTLFIVLTGSGWEEVMFLCMMAEEAQGVGAPFILFYFIIQNYIVLNLFVGAILANMSSVEVTLT